MATTVIMSLASIWLALSARNKHKLNDQSITTISINNDTKDVTFKHKGTKYSILNTKECMIVKLMMFNNTLDKVIDEVIELGPKDMAVGYCFVKE